ncbi:Discoidin domain-containing receptor 2 [Fasciola gigantica]|uniref:Discoidin domain-containing receptor 2 n=1 Tax=Fasciola gigantica TaxID=46835 RepID=A0A504XNQ2_FASGI|nr:Discoidin domain-containing receptor 2 [Fasciola gigantica]
MYILSYLRIYVLLNALRFGAIQCSKNVRTVRRGLGPDSQCMSPLIKSHEEFPDSAFSASSTLEDRTEFQPYQARLPDVYGSKEHTSGHAWCPNTPIEESLREWIQAEFSDLVMIGAIFTAGRGDGNVKEFMPNFVLKYQREDNGPWYEHVKRDGTRVLRANSDPRNLARATLDSMVIAKRIRIYPYSRDGKQQVCLRFALLGCKFPDGVVSYGMPQGGDRSFSTNPVPLGNPIGSFSANFRDLSYDGQLVGTNDHLTDGMGQLMDNVAYLGNVTTPLAMYPSKPGFHFVGWYQHGQTDVPIVFKFDTARTFTWVRLFTFDSIPLRARLFSRVSVAFSMDGQTYNHSVEVFTGRAQLYDPRTAAFSRSRRAEDGVDRFVKQTRATTSAHSPGDPLIYVDQDWDGALVLEADLGGRVGRFVRLSLTATDGWVLLSEVQFNSSIAKQMKNEIPAATAGTVLTGTGSQVPNEISFGHLSLPIEDPVESGNRPVSGVGDSSATSTSLSTSGRDMDEVSALELSSRGLFTNPLPFVIAIAILLFLLSTVVLIWLCTRRHQKRSQLRLHRKGLIGSDSTKPAAFHPSSITGVGGMHQPSGLIDVPGVFGFGIGGGGVGPGAHEATKLLSGPLYPGLNSTSTSCPGQSTTPLANGIHPSGHLTHDPNPTTNGPVSLGLAYPGRTPGAGVILPCSPSSSCSSHTSVVDPMTGVGCGLTVVSTIASPTQQQQQQQPLPPPPTSTNMYAGTDVSCMTGGSKRTQAPMGYLPAFIALPTNNPVGGFVLQPIHYNPTGPLSPSQIGTPDTGSLYTSIRLSATQTPPVKSSTTSTRQSESEMTSPKAVWSKAKLTCRNDDHDGPGSGDGGVGSVLTREEDTDDDVADLHEDVSPEIMELTSVNRKVSQTSSASPTADENRSHVCDAGYSNQMTGVVTTCMRNSCEVNPRYSGDGQTLSEELTESHTSAKCQQPLRQPRLPSVPSIMLPNCGKRHSGCSLPDGEESQSYANLLVLSNGSCKEGMTIHFLRQTPSGYILQPCGPEYASASLFGFTPPPSDTAPCSSAPPTCTESMPATHYRPTAPNYTISFARPAPALISSPGTVYSGPALPVTATTLRRVPPGQQATATSNASHLFQSTQAAGVLFLPHSALTNSCAEDAAAIGLYQTTVNGFPASDFGASYNIYQPIRSRPPEEPIQQHADGQRTTMNALQDNWMYPTHPEDVTPGHGPIPAGSGGLYHQGPIQLVATSGVMDLSHQQSPNISPQHYYPASFIFPSVPPLPGRPPTDVTVRTGVPLIEHQTFVRGSPVGANTSAVMNTNNLSGNYVPRTSEASSRDGASSSRLSIYSVCI